MDNRIELAQKALEDKAFVEKLLSLEEPEDVQKAYAEKGVDLTLDEVKMMGQMLAADGNEAELDANQLDAVSGGVALATITAIVGGVTLIIDVGTYHRKKYGKW